MQRVYDRYCFIRRSHFVFLGYSANTTTYTIEIKNFSLDGVQNLVISNQCIFQHSDGIINNKDWFLCKIPKNQDVLKQTFF